MINAENDRSGHSYLGIASFILAASSGLLLAGLGLLAWLLSDWNPPGDEVAYGFGLLMVGLLAVLAQISALGLGIAGMIQRRHKRLFAFLGMACSILVLVVILAQMGLADVASFFASFTEPPPKVHIVSPKSE